MDLEAVQDKFPLPLPQGVECSPLHRLILDALAAGYLMIEFDADADYNSYYPVFE